MNTAAAQRWSLWAIASLVCSALLCPFISIMGPLLGVIGLVQIRLRPHYRGKQLAWAGIILGLVVTLGWTLAAIWWDGHVREPIRDGPSVALRSGLEGNIAEFQRRFTGTGRNLPPEDARAFLHEVGLRYGKLIEVRQRTTDEKIPLGEIDRTAPMIPYIFVFEGAEIEAEARFRIWDHAKTIPRAVTGWEYVLLIDPVLGDLHYPGERADAPALESEQ